MRLRIYDIKSDEANEEELLMEAAYERFDNVARLWRLLGETLRAERMMTIIEKLPEADDLGRVFLDLFEIDELLQLIDEVVEKSEASLTTHWRVRPEKIEYVIVADPSLIVYEELIDKRRVPSLSRPLVSAVDLKVFLSRAFKAGSRLLVD
jgi:hypothetical protein